MLDKYNLTIEKLYKHKDWNGKNCPEYILPHWNDFKEKVKNEMLKCKNSGKSETTSNITIYKVIENDNTIASYANLENAKANCKDGQKVVDSKGNVVYPTSAAATTSDTTPKDNSEKINVKYRVFASNKWLGEITNCEDLTENGYAGIERYPIKRLAAQSDKGKLSYRVHLKNGGWLNWISQYNTNDSKNGYAGLLQVDVDGIQMKLEDLDGYDVRYRVSNTGSNEYYPWVVGLEDYAGSFGKTVDKIQIEIIKI